MPSPEPLLLDRFFTLAALSAETGRVQAQVQLNERHAIFGGHFPAQPVVPGVCVITMVKEVLAHHLGKELLLRSCATVKFMHPISPRDMPVLDLVVDFTPHEDFLDFQATVQHQGQLLSRFGGRFQVDFL